MVTLSPSSRRFILGLIYAWSGFAIMWAFWVSFIIFLAEPRQLLSWWPLPTIDKGDASLHQAPATEVGPRGTETAYVLRLMAKAGQYQVWWLESGRERCSKCGHSYVYETGYYCEGCDGPLCSICVETVAVSVVCVQCDDSEKGEP